MNKEYINDTAVFTITREQCIQYRIFSEFGRKIVETLPDLASSAPREIVVNNAPPEAVAVFNHMLGKCKIEESVKHISIDCRTFGTGYFMLNVEGLQVNEYAGLQDIQEKNIALSSIDPLHAGGSNTCQDPTSIYYMKIEHLRIGGRVAHPSRSGYINNTNPIYTIFTNATLNYGGFSVFQNITELLDLMPSLQSGIKRLIEKGFCLVVKSDRGEADSTTGLMSENLLAGMVQNMNQYGTILMDKRDDVDFFDLKNAGDTKQIFDLIRENISIGVHDTPASLMLDRSMSNGLSEGSEDMKAVLMALDTYNKTLIPIYEVVDKIIMYKAWTPSFFKSMQTKYPKQYASKQYMETISNWIKDFKYEFGNPYPETKTAKLTREGVFLDNLSKVKELGGDSNDMSTNLEEAEIFTTPIQISETTESSSDSNIETKEKHMSIEEYNEE